MLVPAAVLILAACGGASMDPEATRHAVFTERHPTLHAPGAAAAPPFLAAAGEPVDDEDAAHQLLDHGERSFTAYFPSHQATRAFDTWFYRFYPETGTYLGVNRGDVYVAGGTFGGDIVRVGPLTDYVTPILTRPTAIGRPNRSRVVKGSTVVLDGSRSTDPNGDPLRYRWLLTSKPAASSASFLSPDAQRSDLVLDQVGEYDYTLIVNDGRLDSKPYRSAVVAGENYDGRWAGTTSQGLPLEFEIVDSRLRSVTLAARFGSTCDATATIAGTFDAELGIANFTAGSLAFVGTSVSLIQGTFAGLTQATGTFSALMNEFTCLASLSNVTWTATRR